MHKDSGFRRAYDRGPPVIELSLSKCGQHGANSFEEQCDIILITSAFSVNSIWLKVMVHVVVGGKGRMSLLWRSLFATSNFVQSHEMFWPS